MTQNRTIDNYGGVKIDAGISADPEAELTANEYDRLAEDASQFSRTSTKIDVKFVTSSAGAPVSITVVACQTQWGTGIAYNPTIQKTGTGVYVITFAESYDDGLVGTAADAISETETLALEFARGDIMANVDGEVHCTASANVVTAYVRESGSPSDLMGTATIWVSAS